LPVPADAPPTKEIRIIACFCEHHRHVAGPKMVTVPYVFPGESGIAFILPGGGWKVYPSLRAGVSGWEVVG